MSVLTQFSSKGPTKLITNKCSAGSTHLSNLQTGADAARRVLSGALTAATLATALSVSGSGDVPLLLVYAVDSTARTIRVKVTVDGTVVYDATSDSLSANGHGHVVAGELGASNTAGNNLIGSGLPVSFETSLLVEIASSLTETDKLTTAYILHKR